MKILVINGSPKRERSDNMHITRAFLAGMNDAQEQSIRTIHVADQHIEYCAGCLNCMRNGGECIHRDDMRAILDAFLESDVLLFSFPLYCYGMPAQLKTLIDRMLPLSGIAMRKAGERYEHVPQADTSRLRQVVICGCGFPNARKNFEGLEMQLALLFRGNAAILTVPEAPMFNAPEAAPVTVPFLEIVRQAGYEYVQDGAITPETMARLAQPMIPEEVYAEICNRNR